MFWCVSMIPIEEYARSVSKAKKLLPHLREYLEELLGIYVKMEPWQRKFYITDRGYSDPYYITYVREKDRIKLIKLLRKVIQ